MTATVGRRAVLRRDEFRPADLASLLAEYRCDSTSGSTLVDSSGRGKHAALSGHSWTAGGLRFASVPASCDTPIPYSSVGTLAFCLDPTMILQSRTFLAHSTTDFGSLICRLAGTIPAPTIPKGGLFPEAQGIVAADFNTPDWPTTVIFSFGTTSRVWLHGKPPDFGTFLDVATVARTGNLRLFTSQAGDEASGTLFYGVVVLGSPCDDALAARLHRYLLRKQAVGRHRVASVGGPRELTPNLLARSGNSYVNLMSDSFATLKTPFEYINSAIAGGPPDQVVTQARQAILPLFRPHAKQNVFVVWPTPNSNSVPLIYDSAKSICQQMRLAGYRTVVVGPISASGFDGTKNAVQALFTDPTTGVLSFADAYVDFSDAPQLFADGAYTSTTYYLDGLHCTPLSYTTIIEPKIAAAITGILPPVASFTTSAGTVAVGGTVTCTDTSDGPVTSRAWSAVGQSTGTTYASTATNPTFTLAVEDTYQITLTATNSHGSDQASQTVTADPSGAIAALGPHVWIDASDGQVWTDAARSVPAVNGSAVYSASDRSGHGRHATQPTLARRPEYVNPGGGVTRCLRFTSAANKYLAFGNIFSGVTAGELFIIMKQGPTFATLSLDYEFGSPVQGDLYTFGGGIYDAFGSTARKDGINSQAGAAVVLSDPNLINVRSAAGDYSYWINGVQKFATATNTVGWSANAGIGGRPSDAAGGDIDISEVLVFSAVLSAPNRATVVAYLKSRWGTP